MVHLVFQIQIEVVEAINAKDECALINVQLGLLHTLAVLRIDCDCQRLWELALAALKLGGLEGALMALPGVHDVVRVRVHDFVFGLNDTRGPLFIG